MAQSGQSAWGRGAAPTGSWMGWRWSKKGRIISTAKKKRNSNFYIMLNSAICCSKCFCSRRAVCCCYYYCSILNLKQLNELTAFSLLYLSYLLALALYGPLLIVGVDLADFVVRGGVAAVASSTVLGERERECARTGTPCMRTTDQRSPKLVKWQ